MQPLFRAIALHSNITKHKAAFLPVAQQCCLTQKAALWYDLWSLAFLGEAGRGHDEGLAAPLPRLVPFLWAVARFGLCCSGERWWCGYYSMGGGKVQLAS